MGRSLGVVVVGWVSGFLIAIAWGATRANNPRLASTLSGWAIVGMVVTALLLLSIAVSDRSARRREAHLSGTPVAPVERDGASATLAKQARAAAAAEAHSATRIAELEARLAREQEELDAAVASLAATELAETGHVTGGRAEPEPDAAAATLEPALRREVVDTVAQLVGRAGPEETAALASELGALLDKPR